MVWSGDAAAAARSAGSGSGGRWWRRKTTRPTPQAERIAIRRQALLRPAASASGWEAPSARWLLITALKSIATAATASAAPTYRAMFEMPDAWPTSSGATAAVEPDDAG